MSESQEGTNAIVVNSGDQRTKICSKDKALTAHGDILELIPGKFYFKLITLAACPNLRKIPHGLIIHGESGGSEDHMKKSKPASWVLHWPPLPISYGTHHSKAMLLVYPRGVRVVVHTANLIYVDWNNKTQGLWMQDFSWKDQKNLSCSSPFENDLLDYLTALKIFHGHGTVDITRKMSMVMVGLYMFDSAWTRTLEALPIRGFTFNCVAAHYGRSFRA